MTASQINQPGQTLAGDMIAWGAAAIGIAVVAAAAMWVIRVLR